MYNNNDNINNKSIKEDKYKNKDFIKDKEHVDVIQDSKGINKVTKKKSRGRPKITIDYKKVEELGKIHCSVEEIAKILGCSVSKLNSDEKFKEVHGKSTSSFKVSLRRRIDDMVEKHPSVAIFLAKNYLGMSDRVESTIDGTTQVQIVNDIGKSKEPDKEGKS